MFRLIETRCAPKEGRHRISVREGEESSFDAMAEWLRENVSRSVWWTRTHFRASTDRKMAPRRQRHFTGGYWQATFWFASKRDAALFGLFWS